MESDFEDDERAEGLQAQKNDLLEGMREYLAGILDGGGEAGYNGTHIGECGRILDAYLATVEEAADGDDDAVMAAVQFTVLSLNGLNERCHGSLIETDQREQICDIINRAATKAGVGAGEDLTAQWREW